MSLSYARLLRRLVCPRSQASSSSSRRAIVLSGAAAGRQQQQSIYCSARFLSSGSGGGDGGDDDDKDSNTTPKDSKHHHHHHKNHSNPKTDKPSKQSTPGKNLDRDVLQPAAEGVLQQPHASGIPHLLGRHAHATLEPVRGRAGKKKQAEDALAQDENDDQEESSEAAMQDAVEMEDEEDAAAAIITPPPPPPPLDSSIPDRYRMFDALSAGKMGNGDDDYHSNYDITTSTDEELEHYAALLDQDATFGYWNVKYYEDNLLLDAQLQQTDSRMQTHEAALQAVEDQRIRHKQQLKLRGELGGTTNSSSAETETSTEDKGDEDKGEDGDKGEGDNNETTAATTATTTTPSFKDKVPNLDIMDDYDTWFEQNHDLMQLAENDNLGFIEDAMEEMSAKEREEFEKDYYSVGNIRMMNGRAVSGAGGMDYDTGKRTKWQMATHKKPHPDSAREPIPNIPASRQQPSLEFVETYRRFLYVFGLPVLDPGDGSRPTLRNPVHFEQMRKELARVTGINAPTLEAFYPATPHSGYVGFDSTEALAAALVNGPAEGQVCRPPVWSVYNNTTEDYPTRQDPDKIQAFVNGNKNNDTSDNNNSNNNVLVLSLIPRNHTCASLLKALFPPGTAVGDAYNQVSTNDIYFLNNTTALVRFSTAQEAESALHSQLVATQLRDSPQLGSAYRIRYQIARREMVFSGWRGPYIGRIEVRKLGRKLIVDGDMPTKDFYISHADTVLVWNLDPAVSKWELSQLVQPYSTLRRDVDGSIEMVTCEDYLPTGQAYIGFDYPGDADAMLEALGQSCKMGDRTIHFKKMKNRSVLGQPYKGPERRPDRTVEELWRDLDGWERFVDPADLETLEKNGIEKWVLDDAFRVIRYKNETFGAFDQGMRRESLQPELERGQQYKTIVQEYVAQLLECLPTREKPGAIYEALHFPDQPIDTSIFDHEVERKKVLRAYRAATGGAEKVPRKSVGSK